MTELAFHVEALREVLGISVTDLADRIEKDASHLRRVLNGEAALTNEIAWRTVAEMANVMRYRATAGEAVTVDA